MATSIARLNTTLSALKNVMGKPVVAFLTPVPAATIRPILMVTLVVLNQITHFSLPHLFSRLTRQVCSMRISIDDCIGASNQPVFAKVLTAARLPLASALITELGFAQASCDGKFR